MRKMGDSGYGRKGRSVEKERGQITVNMSEKLISNDIIDLKIQISYNTDKLIYNYV